MSGGKYRLRMNQSATTLVNVQYLSGLLIDHFLFQNRHHPRELAELRLVVGLSGDSETDTVRMTLSASFAHQGSRSYLILNLYYVRRLAADIQVIVAWTRYSAKKFKHIMKK